MNITRMGIDLAKNVFQLHGVDQYEKVVFRKQLKRDELLELFANKPPMLIGIEACGGAHYWARMLTKLGLACLPSLGTPLKQWHRNMSKLT